MTATPLRLPAIAPPGTPWPAAPPPDPAPRPDPSGRPLAGLSVLVVEDSRFASEAVRLLCLRSGARIRRAASLQVARRHLSVYRPALLIVDLGLPDGSGCDLLAELAGSPDWTGALIAISGDPEREAEARACGAKGFLLKPITSLAAFQAALLPLLPEGLALTRIMPPLPDAAGPPAEALVEDLGLAVALIDAGPDLATQLYLASFLEGLALQSGDGDLLGAARELRRAEADARPTLSELAKVSGLLQQRLDPGRCA